MSCAECEQRQAGLLAFAVGHKLILALAMAGLVAGFIWGPKILT